MDDKNLIKPAHRDDIPLEAMQAFEAAMADQFPGFKVVCVGDIPGELPPEIQEKLEAIQILHARSFVEGRCIDCGRQMANPPPDASDDAAWDAWQPDEGWLHFTNGAGEVTAFQCPECDSREKD